MRIGHWMWRLVKAVIVLAVVMAIVYWVKFSPVPVAEHVVERGTIVAEVMGTGTLEARVETTISAKISGRITQVLVDQGDRVEHGDVLVHLDDEELQQQVAIADANVQSALAAIDRLKTDKNRAEAVLDQAKRSHSRAQTLVSQNAVSRDESDRATEGLAIAESGLSRADAAIAEGQKALIAAEKNLEYHRTRLADTTVHAPFSGLITKRTREPGDVIVPGSSILNLISTDELWISAWVDETEMAKLRVDQEARVVFRSEPERSYRGTVARLGLEADRETREFIVDVKVLELPVNWAVGQRAEAFIEVGRREDAVLLPATLLSLRDERQGVFVLDGEKARWRPVSVGLRNRDRWEITEGLAAGDRVIAVSSPRSNLVDGRKVTTK